jgi:hypothetical protein
MSTAADVIDLHGTQPGLPPRVRSLVRCPCGIKVPGVVMRLNADAIWIPDETWRELAEAELRDRS